MSEHSLTILFLLLAINLAIIIIAARRNHRPIFAAPSSGRFNLTIAIVTAVFVGIVIGSQFPTELKSFTETWGLHTMLVIGAISLLPSILRPAQPHRAEP